MTLQMQVMYTLFSFVEQQHLVRPLTLAPRIPSAQPASRSNRLAQRKKIHVAYRHVRGNPVQFLGPMFELNSHDLAYLQAAAVQNNRIQNRSAFIAPSNLNTFRSKLTHLCKLYSGGNWSQNADCRPICDTDSRDEMDVSAARC
ncbi:hypothetical protein SRHO_G00228400 [Serrasalmus rhombeus]